MRKLIVSTFVSLDGVMQSPGGPQEDPTQRFAFGGWNAPYWDESMDPSMSGFDSGNRELVLGRKTYEIFEAHWPYQPADDPTAKSLNAVKKYVASHTLKTLSWHNAQLLGGDAAAAIAQLKQQAGPDLQIIGSGNLVQSLQAASLIDEYNVWIFPVLLGQGKRLFETSIKPGGLQLVSAQTSNTGVLMTTYIPVGEVPLGSFVPANPSARELERRAKLEG